MNTSTAWMIIPTFYPVIGGTQSQVQMLSEVLKTHNWSIHVLTRQHSYAHPHGLPASDMLDGIPITRLYSNGGTKVGSLFYVLGGLWHLLRHGRRNIYHAHDIGAPGWLAVAARFLFGGRCIIKLRTGCYLYRQRFSSGLARWQFALLLRLADRVHVVNSEVENLVGDLGVPAERVIRVPNGVDTSQFYPVSSQEKLATRRRLGLPVEQTIVLYVGRFDPLKGVDILLRAWALLPENTRRQVKLVLVGDGPDREELLGIIDFLGIRESVLLAGERQNVRDYYWAADVFVLPSRTEGLSNALIEAMACELPVLASDVGGSLDVVVEGENGVLFESENEPDLANKLMGLITGRDSWASMGAQARQRVVKYADLTFVLDRLRATYHDLLPA